MGDFAVLDERDRSLRLVKRLTLWLAGVAAVATAAFGVAAAHAKAARQGQRSPANNNTATATATDDGSNATGSDDGSFAPPAQAPSQSFGPPAAVSGGS